MTSLSACRAVPELSPGCRRASSKVGMVWSIARAPRCSCKPSKACAAAARTFASSSTRHARTVATMSSSCPSRCVSVAFSLSFEMVRISYEEEGGQKLT